MQKATIHQLTTMLSTSKNVLFPGHNHLLTTRADDLTLLIISRAPAWVVIKVKSHQHWWTSLEVDSMVVALWIVTFLSSVLHSILLNTMYSTYHTGRKAAHAIYFTLHKNDWDGRVFWARFMDNELHVKKAFPEIWVNVFCSILHTMYLSVVLRHLSSSSSHLHLTFISSS